MSFMPDAEAFEATRRAHFAVTVHNKEDFEGMRRAGRLAEVLDLLVPEVKPGVTTEYLDKLAYDYVVAHGGVPACLGYRGYRHTHLHLDQPRRLPRHSRRQAAARRRYRQHRRHRDRGRLARRHQPHVPGRRREAEGPPPGRHHL